MPLEKIVPLTSKDEWYQALKGLKFAFAHTWGNCQTMFLKNGLATYLYIFETGADKIVCPFSERKFDDTVDIFTPYGYSGFIESNFIPNFSDHWNNFTKSRGYVCGYFALNPILSHPAYFSKDKFSKTTSVYILDLTLPEDKLYQNITTNGKRKLKNWNKTNSSIVTDKNILKDYFLELFPLTMKRVDATDLYNYSEEALSFLMDQNNCLLIGAEQKGKIEAISLFVYTPYVADYFFNASLVEGRFHSARLIWEAALRLKLKNIPFLNLGGTESAGDGLSRFKEMFGGKKYVFQYLKQIYDKGKYIELCKNNGVDPNLSYNYFPSYRS